jgi:Family of unknown function (DUF5771)
MSVRIHIEKKGSLKDLGYSSSLPVEERHKALKRAISEYGVGSVSKKLSAVATLQKNTNPTASRKFKADEHWVMKQK